MRRIDTWRRRDARPGPAEGLGLAAVAWRVGWSGPGRAAGVAFAVAWGVAADRTGPDRVGGLIWRPEVSAWRGSRRGSGRAPRRKLVVGPTRTVGSCGPDGAGVVVVWGLGARPAASRSGDAQSSRLAAGGVGSSLGVGGWVYQSGAPPGHSGPRGPSSAGSIGCPSVPGRPSFRAPSRWRSPRAAARAAARPVSQAARAVSSAAAAAAASAAAMSAARAALAARAAQAAASAARTAASAQAAAASASSASTQSESAAALAAAARAASTARAAARAALAARAAAPAARTALPPARIPRRWRSRPRPRLGDTRSGRGPGAGPARASDGEGHDGAEGQLGQLLVEVLAAHGGWLTSTPVRHIPFAHDPRGPDARQSRRLRAEVSASGLQPPPAGERPAPGSLAGSPPSRRPGSAPP